MKFKAVKFTHFRINGNNVQVPHFSVVVWIR